MSDPSLNENAIKNEPVVIMGDDVIDGSTLDEPIQKSIHRETLLEYRKNFFKL